ncbi:ABC transporter substrate-binding protein [Ventrimonas sp. CLA-AP-H27]|uniref:ABC transporter substrate-binding protein n=1 Tax=Ventrimonas faecis TaxID=3133170 RepID=A0ABV1HK57_9FIRM
MKRNMLKVVAASLAGAMLLTACGGSSSATQTTAAAGDSTETSAAAEAGSTGGEKVITMAQTGDWDTFMPMNTTNAGADNVIELMFDRLMVINTDGTFAPRLADSWETNEAQDKITYHLNENAKWQDGEPVTAEDVVYSAQVASSSEFNYLRRIRMQYFAGTDETGCETGTDSVEVKALDDHTVEFTLKTPMDPAIIYALVNRDFFIMPKHLLSNISDADLVNDAFWQNPVGSGPCIFDSMESGVSIEFKANKDYYLGAPDFDRLVFKKVQSSNLLSGLMSGDIDVLSGNSQIPLADWEAAKNTQGIVTKSVPTFAYQYMAMNTSRDYLTEDVRHAISLAINRQVIVDQLLQGEARIAIGPLAEDHPYFDEKLLPIEYDPEKAKSMLEAAGWDSNRELDVQVSTGNEVREKSAILIQQDLQKIGIKTKIQTLDFPTLLTNARNGDYDLCFIGSSGSVDPSESVPNVTAGYMNNFAQLSDPTLGEIGESGAKEITFEARKKIYDQYQEELFKQMPMAFLYHTNDLFAYSDKLENVREGALDYNINKNVWEWKVNK